MSTDTGSDRARHILDGVRVLDLTTGIAGPVLHQAPRRRRRRRGEGGAERRRSAAAPGAPARSSSSSTPPRGRSPRDDGLAEDADIILSNEAGDVDRLRGANPAAVVVTITPFGGDGPWADRPWTEFTLQAACGSIGQRGLPEQPPLAAGGRIGEWVAGTYAALAALAACREARRCGLGEDVDVAILDCMAVAMVTYPSVFSSFFGLAARCPEPDARSRCPRSSRRATATSSSPPTAPSNSGTSW